MANLYEITTTGKELMRAIALGYNEETGEITSPDTQLELDKVLREDLPAKANDYMKLIFSIEAEAKAMKEEEDRLKARRKKAENLVAHLRDRLKEAMISLDIDNLKTTVATITTNNTKEVVYDETKIPNNWFILEPTLDKAKLRKYVLAGNKVEGVTIVDKKTLTVRR